MNFESALLDQQIRQERRKLSVLPDLTWQERFGVSKLRYKLDRLYRARKIATNGTLRGYDTIIREFKR